MGITVAAQEGVAHVALDGELTVCTVGQIGPRLVAVVFDHETIEIDLGAIEEIDTAGLQLLLMVKRSAGREVRLVNHAAAVMRLLDLANLGGVLGDPLLISDRDQA